MSTLRRKPFSAVCNALDDARNDLRQAIVRLEEIDDDEEVANFAETLEELHDRIKAPEWLEELSREEWRNGSTQEENHHESL